MDRIEMSKEINQSSEELRLLADQNEKLIQDITNGLDNHNDLTAKKAREKLKLNGDQLEVELKWLGMDGKDIQDNIPVDPPPFPPGPLGNSIPPNPPFWGLVQKNTALLKLHKSYLSDLVKNTEQLDDQGMKVLSDKLQIAKKQLEVDNLRLSLQDF